MFPINILCDFQYGWDVRISKKCWKKGIQLNFFNTTINIWWSSTQQIADNQKQSEENIL